MQRLTNMTLRMRFLLLAAGLTLVFVISNGILISQSIMVLNHAESLSDRDIPVLIKAHELKLAVVQVQQWLTDISATRARDGLDDGFDEAGINAEKFKTLISELRQLDAEHAKRYQAMLPVFDDYYRVGREMAQAYIDEGPAGGNRMMGQFDSVAEKMTKEMDGLVAGVEQRTMTGLVMQAEITRKAQFILLAGIVLVLGGIAMLYFIMSGALNQLPRVIADLKQLADGDLTVSMQVGRQDEIGELQQSLQSMRDCILMVMSKITDTTKSLNHAANEMAMVTRQTSNNVQRQQSDTEQVATAMNEMTAIVQEVSGNILRTAQSAEAANNEAMNSKQVMDNSISQIQALATQIESAAASVYQLEQDSGRITAIVDVIKGVAEQTNLLALNAAIEAARAGEQGRGFAVVADEVRTLASRTQQSTEEINQMIDKLVCGTKQTVEVMDSSRHQVGSAVDQVAVAGSALSEISTLIGEINEMSSQIAGSASEQTSVTNEINRNIMNIADVAGKNATDVERLSSASQNLERTANELQTLIKQFKI